jgi:hypothetical protein
MIDISLAILLHAIAIGFAFLFHSILHLDPHDPLDD